MIILFQFEKISYGQAHKMKNQVILALMDSDLPSRRQIRESLQQIDDAQQVALGIMVKIAGEYKSCNDLKDVQKVTGEMEDIEEVTTEVTERAQTYLDSRREVVT